MLSLVLAFAAASAAMPASCAGSDTISISECGKELSKQADNDLNRYYQAALDHLKSTKEDKARGSLIEAQRAWIIYRDSECNAVYEDWIDGSIRYSMQDNCIIDLTKIRTYVIWRDWLNPMQGEPILPRPNISSVTRADETS